MRSAYSPYFQSYQLVASGGCACEVERPDNPGDDFLAQLTGYGKRPTKRAVEARIERVVERFLVNFHPK
jgi:hypothetical protein